MPSVLLLVEGEGDVKAVPILVRRILEAKGICNVSLLSEPLRVGNIRKLARSGELERFLRYASSRRPSAVLIVQDCDDECPAVVSRDYIARASQMQPPLGCAVFVAFLKCELETLFLVDLRNLAERCPTYGWRLLDYSDNHNWESTRGAKEALRKFLPKDKGYKELVDSPKLMSHINVDAVRARSRSFEHLENILIKKIAQLP